MPWQPRQVSCTTVDISGWKRLRLARELGEKIGSRPGQAHGARAPRAVRRKVEHLIVGTGRGGGGHRVLQSGAAGTVTAQTLIGRDEGTRRIRSVSGHPNVVIGLRWHIERAPQQSGTWKRQPAQVEGFQKRRVDGCWRAAARRAPFLASSRNFKCCGYSRTNQRMGKLCLHHAWLTEKGLRQEEILAEEAQERSRFTADVVQAGEGFVVAGGSVAIRAISGQTP